MKEWRELVQRNKECDAEFAEEGDELVGDVGRPYAGGFEKRVEEDGQEDRPEGLHHNAHFDAEESCHDQVPPELAGL